MSVVAYPAHFLELGQHDHNGGVVLPEHAPEILCCILHRTLGGDIGRSVAIAVNEAGVDIVAALDSMDGGQVDTTRFVWQNVDQAVLVFVARQIGRYELGRVHLDIGQLLELHLHAGDTLAGLRDQ